MYNTDTYFYKIKDDVDIDYKNDYEKLTKRKS